MSISKSVVYPHYYYRSPFKPGLIKKRWFVVALNTEVKRSHLLYFSSHGSAVKLINSFKHPTVVLFPKIFRYDSPALFPDDLFKFLRSDFDSSGLTTDDFRVSEELCEK